jgi:serine/threonine protein kinase
MNDKDLIYLYEPIWGSWKIDGLIGTGSTGNVYKVIKNDYNRDYISAVKFIEVPTYEQYKSVLSYFNNGDKKSISEYFENIVQSILNEIELLYDLKEHGNIINYEDHLIKKIDEKDEWHILIRMEFANSLDVHITNNPISEKDIIKIGIDICSALEFCHEKNILHRDIKEANIFVSKNKIYKLGDFSISKEVSELTMAHTKVGTFNYMAPEVFNNKAYTKNADLYSLGIVLYKLSNNGRMPFLPNYPNKILPNDIEKSNMSRLGGESLSKPDLISENLFSILKKACEYDQSKRYSNASEMKLELEKIYNDSNDNAISFLGSENNDEDKSINNTHTYFDLKSINKTSTYNEALIKDSLKSDNSSENKNGTKEFRLDHPILKEFKDKNTNNYTIDENDDTDDTDDTENTGTKKNLFGFIKNAKFDTVYNNIFKGSMIIISAILVILFYKYISTINSSNSAQEPDSTSSSLTNTKTPESTDEENTLDSPDNSNVSDDSNNQNSNYYNNNGNSNNNNSNNNNVNPVETDIEEETPTDIETDTTDTPVETTDTETDITTTSVPTENTTTPEPSVPTEEPSVPDE